MISPLVDMSQYSYAFPAVPPVIVGLCMAVLTAAVVVREKASRASVAFALLTVSSALWLLSFAGIYGAVQPEVSLAWVKLEHVGVIFIPSSLFYFTLVLVRRLDSYRALARAGFAGSIFFLVGLFTSDHFVMALADYEWGRYPIYGWMGTLFVVFFLAQYAASLALFWGAYRRTSIGAPQSRLKMLFAAFCFGLLGAVDFLPCYGFFVYPVGYLPVYASVLLLAQVIWRYGFPDITPAFAAAQILDTMPGSVFVLDQDGIICIVNPAACQLFRRDARDMIGQPMSRVMEGFFRPEHRDTLIDQGGLRDYDVMIHWGTEAARVCTVSASIIRDERGRAAAFVCLAKDVTEERRAEEALRESEQRFRLLVEGVKDYAIVMFDTAGNVQSWNSGAERIYGYSAPEIVGRHFSVFFTREDVMRSRPKELLDSAVREGRSEEEGWRVRKDGTRFWANVVRTPLHDRDGNVRGFVGITRDVTERRLKDEALEAAQATLQKAYDELEDRVRARTSELEQEILRRERAEHALQDQAVRDALTGLFNRRGFLTMAEQALALARRRQSRMLIFMADLDDLKPINDTYGHAEGDYALLQAGMLLKRLFRESDVVARVGGDEFAVAAVDIHDSLENIRARLRERLDDYNRYSGRPYKISLSLGAVQVDPKDSSALEHFMQQADNSLYRQKRRKESSAARYTPT